MRMEGTRTLMDQAGIKSGKERFFSSDQKAISLVGEEVAVVGTLNFGSGVVRVDGRLNGKIIGLGTVIVGEKGLLQGEVQVGALFICGRAEGTVTASECVHITRTGKLYGKIQSRQFIIEEGGIFEGESNPIFS